MAILKGLGYILETVGLLDKYRDIFKEFSPSKGYEVRSIFPVTFFFVAI